MPEGLELSIIEDWLDTYLKDNVPTASDRVFNGLAPVGTTFPYVIYTYLDATDMRGIGTTLILTSGLWLIKGVTQATSDTTNLKDIVGEIHEAMTIAVPVSVTGGMIHGSVRERPFRLIETEESKQIRHLGGEYNIAVRAT